MHSEPNETGSAPQAALIPGLTARQSAFVEQYVHSGGKVGVSALKAGYTTREVGSRLLQNPTVLKAITERQLLQNTTNGVQAIGTMVKLMKTARSDYVKLQAAQAVVALSPFQPPERHLHRVSGDLSVSFDTGGVQNTEFRDVTPLSHIENPPEAPQLQRAEDEDGE